MRRLAACASVNGDSASVLPDAAASSSAQSSQPQPPQQQPGQQQPYTLSDAVAALLAGEPIAHIVVLMMENRSFDHLLGWLHTDYSARVDGLSPGMSLPRDPRNPSKGRVPVTRGGFDVGPDDPKHDFDATRQQIDVDRHSAMDGFVLNALEHKHNESNPVSMFDSESAPIINALAREFAVFDRWHSSIPGPTDPNRAFAMSGTSRGTLENYNGTRWTQQSFFDQLAQYNRSFGAYYQDDLWAIGHFDDMHKPDNLRRIHEMDRFFADAANGTLPTFSWLQPRMLTTKSGQLPTWQHPDASLLEGERLIKQVYEALRAGPGWGRTLFLVTYDEHGGFYDHVPPPARGVPSPDGIPAPNGFAFDRLGVRVPTLAISPWIEKGTIISDAFPGEQPTPTSAFDSTSIMATARRLLKLDAAGAPFLSRRVAWSNTFAALVRTRAAPRTDCPLLLPALPPAPPGAVEQQRARPLNEHFASQLAFYCVENRESRRGHAQTWRRPQLDDGRMDAFGYVRLDAATADEAREALEVCAARGDHERLTTQGAASDWIVDQVAAFWKLRRMVPLGEHE